MYCILASVDATADNTNAATQNGIEEHYPSIKEYEQQ